MSLYQIWGPDGIPIDPELYPTVEATVLAAAKFIARYQAQGYYRDSRMQKLTLSELADCLSVEELDARMIPEKAYITYIQNNLYQLKTEWPLMSYAEFLESEECQNLMDLDNEDPEPTSI
jgi:hypothetical protein